MCDQIYNCQRYDFGNTLVCYLSQTWLFNKPTSETMWISKSDLSSTKSVTYTISTIAVIRLNFDVVLGSDLDVEQTGLNFQLCSYQYQVEKKIAYLF